MHRIGIVVEVCFFPILMLRQDKMTSQPSVLAERRDRKTQTSTIGIIALFIWKQALTLSKQVA